MHAFQIAFNQKYYWILATFEKSIKCNRNFWSEELEIWQKYIMSQSLPRFINNSYIY